VRTATTKTGYEIIGVTIAQMSHCLASNGKSYWLNAYPSDALNAVHRATSGTSLDSESGSFMMQEHGQELPEPSGTDCIFLTSTCGLLDGVKVMHGRNPALLASAAGVNFIEDTRDQSCGNHGVSSSGREYLQPHLPAVTWQPQISTRI
jgi:hypothetical protein